MVKLDTDNNGATWDRFFDKFVELGGDGFYSAWSLTYLEPILQDGTVGKKYQQGICPVAEKIQPQLMQFKTNYGNQKEIDRQTEILQKTIRAF